MKIVFIVLMILAILFLILAGACGLVGFSKITEAEQEASNHEQGEMKDIRGRVNQKMNEANKSQDRITFHEEEDGV